MNKNCNILEELQKVDFALLEITLHLDMNPNNRLAQQYHSYYAALRERLVVEYERRYGAMTNQSYAGNCHSWINNPWPWEGEA